MRLKFTKIPHSTAVKPYLWFGSFVGLVVTNQIYPIEGKSGFSFCPRPVISSVSRFFAALALAAGLERAAFLRNLSLAMRIRRCFEGMRAICIRMPQ
jgi:hypothetical protein